MEHREPICNADQIQKAIALAMDIQNAAIATVFIRLSGHVNSLEITIHSPKWIRDVDPDISLRIYGRTEEGTREENEEALDSLSKILSAGPGSDSEEISIIQSKEKQQRRQQFEALKQEFEAA